MQNKPTPARGFTLIELMVVIAIIALLIAILLPSLRNGMQASKDAQCMSNLRQLMIGQVAYAVANDNEFTMSRKWVGNNTSKHQGSYSDPTNVFNVTDGQLYPFMSDNKEAYLCPIAKEVIDTSWFGGRPLAYNYVQNWNVGPARGGDSSPEFEGYQYSLDDVNKPDDLVVFAEENNWAIHVSPNQDRGAGATAGHQISRFAINDGYLVNRFSRRGSPDVDSFATFHRAENDRFPIDGNSNAAFVDGSVQIVEPIAEHKVPFQAFSSEFQTQISMSRTAMWCTDQVQNED